MATKQRSPWNAAAIWVMKVFLLNVIAYVYIGLDAWMGVVRVPDVQLLLGGLDVSFLLSLGIVLGLLVIGVFAEGV